MQVPVSPATELADELLVFVTHLMKGSQSDVLQVAAELDLSMSQLRALHVLEGAERPLALFELAERVGLSVAAMGRAIDGLVRVGLATRTEDREDRRVKRLAVTERGSDAILRLAAARREAVRRFSSTLTDDQRNALSRALAPILARPEVQALRAEMCR